jgi:tetratricopeptide (TPR) repeat protein
MEDIGGSISFRLRGTKSNRDAIGTSITVEAGGMRQTRYLQAGSGFLAQHSKEVFFGVGKHQGSVRATVRWPSGLVQVLESLPVGHRIEVEEGTPFQAKAFAAALPTDAPSPPVQEKWPTEVQTWLIEPLKAPEFSLPDLGGNVQKLASFHDGYLLLTFWSTTAPRSLNQLKDLQQYASALGTSRLRILAINVDQGDANQAARAFVSQQRLSFPVVLASDEVVGIYNIIYRHLHDRRRDMPIPISFLVDGGGMIVKVYEGIVVPERLLTDLKSVPTSPEARMRAALPFPGRLVQTAFVRNDFTYGVAMYQHGYFDQAAESFEQVIAAKPDNADAFYNLGTLYLRRKNYDLARQYLEQTLKLRANYPEAWNNLGMMAAQQGRPDEAIQDFRQSLAQRPNYATAYLNLGNVYRRQKLFDKAQESLTRALALQPDDPEANFSLGMLYAQQSQMKPALDYLQRAVELRPDYAEAFNNMGIVFVRQQDYSKAEEQFKSGIRVAPRFDQSYLNLARLYAMRGDKETAKAVLQELLRVEPDNPGAKQAMELLQ